MSREERLARLAEHPTERAAKLARKKKEIEDREAKDLTFKPKLISKYNRNKTSKFKVDEDADGSIADRLYEEAKERAEMLNAMKLAMESAEVESHPFKPSINPVSEALAAQRPYKPLHQRVGELQRDKNEYLMLLKAELEKENEVHYIYIW